MSADTSNPKKQESAMTSVKLPGTVETIPGVEHLEPQIVFELLQCRACILVDLRGEDRSSGLILDAVHEPAIDKIPFKTKVPDLVRKWAREPLVIFTCQYSAHRAPQCANWYREVADKQQRVAILSGGFRGWEAKGLPVKACRSLCESKVADNYALKKGMQFAASARLV